MKEINFLAIGLAVLLVVFAVIAVSALLPEKEKEGDVPTESFDEEAVETIEYDEHGNLVFFDVDYYYGYETVYNYEEFEIWAPVTDK